MGRLLFFLFASLNILAMDRESPSIAATCSDGAKTYYFSDCDTGGAGTKSNPYCLRPGTSSTNVSLDYLMDGAGSCTAANRTEVAGGDLIYLCCGGPDGCGDATTSCTYDMAIGLQPAANMYFPRVTITNYPGDTPELSGEVNNLAYMFRLRDNQGGFNISGLVFKRTNGKQVDVDCNGDSCGNVTFSNMVFKENNSCAWGDTDGIGNNSSCFVITQDGVENVGEYMFYLLGLGYDWTVIDSTISEVGGMAIRHLMSDRSFASAAQIKDYKVLWARNHFRNMYQIMNMWQTYSWQDLKGAQVTFKENTFEGWWGSLGIEQRNRGAIFENNIFICSDTYSTQRGSGQSECMAAIEVNEGDYSNMRRGGNAGHIFRGNVIQGARLGANRASEKTQNGWLAAGIIWDDSCMDNAQCTGSGQPWCCCIDVGRGRCNSATSGGTCLDSQMNYGCVAGQQYGSAIENNMIMAQYDCGQDSNCSGAESDENAAIYVNTNTPVNIANNTLYSNDYGITVDNSYASGAIHNVENNIVTASAQREMKDRGTSANIKGNNLYDAGTPYANGGATTVCGSINTLGDLSNVCTAPQFLNTSGDPDTWDLHIKATGPDFNVRASGPTEDIDHEQRPIPQFGVIATKYDRGADEVQIAGLAAGYASWAYSAGTECDASAGSTGTVTVTYGNYAPSSTQHNVIMHYYTTGYLPNPPLSISAVSDTCNCTGSDCELGDLDVGEEASCTITFDCTHTGGANVFPQRAAAKVAFWFQSDEYIPEDPLEPADDAGNLPNTAIWLSQIFWIQR